MFTSPRFFAACTVGLMALLSLPAAQAWSWSWGGGEQVKGSGNLVSEAREPGRFDSLALSGDFNVLVRQGESDKVEIKADNNLLPLIETKVVEGRKGRTLEVSVKRGYRLSASQTPQLLVSVTTLRSIALAGSGVVRVEAMKAAEVEASVAGSGDVNFLDLSADKASFSVAGSGTLQAAGHAAALSVSVSGSGDIKTRSLVAEEAKVSIAGSGDVAVNAVKKLHVSIAGSGDVRYEGSPEVKTSIAGSGAVRKF
jgi:hypothetical protein